MSKWVVKRGDTLSSISGKTGVSVDRLAKVNNIKDVNLIFDGSALCVPGPMG